MMQRGRMNRRRFISAAAGALAAPRAAGAQQPGKMHRLAIVHPSAPTAEMAESGNPNYRAFFQGLRRLGYSEGRNLRVERRSAEGHAARLAAIAEEVVRLRPDVIFGSSNRLLGAIKSSTGMIPIVGLVADPVGLGLAASLARPGGNFTGFSIDAGVEILGKRLELLREVMPAGRVMAYLTPRAVWESNYAGVTREAAQRAKVTLIGAPLDDPIDEAEYRRVFAAMSQQGVESLIVGEYAENFTHRRLVAELAAAAKLPAIYAFREYAEAGGLMAYGSDIADIYRRAAGYVDLILKGANPGDLPIQQPTRFELVINLKTAKALGIKFPPALLLRADEVIE